MGDEVKTGVVKGETKVEAVKNPSATADGSASDATANAKADVAIDEDAVEVTSYELETVLGVDPNGRYRRFLKEVD